MMPIRPLRGLGLIEVMVSLAVLGVLLSLAIPSLQDLLDRRRVQAVAAEISSDLAYARAETGLRPQNVAVYFGGNASMSCYTIGFYASGGSCDCTNGQGSACTAVIEHKTRQIPRSIGVSFVSSSAEWAPIATNRISFSSPQMTASVSDFAVTVSGRHAQLKVKLSRLGRISTCSPGGSMNGVPAC